MTECKLFYSAKGYESVTPVYRFYGDDTQEMLQEFNKVKNENDGLFPIEQFLHDKGFEMIAKDQYIKR